MNIDELVEAIKQREADPIPSEIVQKAKALFDNMVLALQQISKAIQASTKTKSNVSVNTDKTEARTRIGRHQFFLQRFNIAAQRRESGGPLVSAVRLYFENTKWAILVFEAFAHQNGNVEITSNVGSMRFKTDDQKAIEGALAAVIHNVVFGGKTYWPDRDEIQKVTTEQLHASSYEATEFLGPEDANP